MMHEPLAWPLPEHFVAMRRFECHLWLARLARVRRENYWRAVSVVVPAALLAGVMLGVAVVATSQRAPWIAIAALLLACAFTARDAYLLGAMCVRTHRDNQQLERDVRDLLAQLGPEP
jgi:hypothetical protein